MDAKASAPETALHLSNSSGFTASTTSLYSGIDNSVRNQTLELDDDSNNIRTGSSHGEFVSGEEEFGTAPERTVVAEPDEETLEKAVGGDGNGSPFVDYVEFPPQKSEEMLLEVSENGANDEKDVGEPKYTALKEVQSGGDEDKGLEKLRGEGSLEENGIGAVSSAGKEALAEMGEKVNTNLTSMVLEKVNREGSEMKDEEVIEEKKIKVDGGEQSMETKEVTELGVGNEKVGYGNSGPENGGLFEVDGVKFTGGGDLFVEDVHVDLLRPGGAVGDVERSKDSEIKGSRIPVDLNVLLDNGYDKVSGDVEIPADKNTELEKDVEPSTGFRAESVYVDSNGDEIENSGDEIEVSILEKDGNSDIEDAVGDAVRKDNQDITDKEVSVDDSGIIGVSNNGEKLDKEIGPEAEIGTKQVACALDTVTDGLDVVVNDEVDTGDGGKTLAIGSVTKIAMTHATEEVEELKSDQTFVSFVSRKLEDQVLDKSDMLTNAEIKLESEDEENQDLDGEDEGEDEDEEEEGSFTDGETGDMIFGGSDAAKQFLEELERGSGVGSHSGAASSHDHSQRIDGQIVTDSDEEVETDEEGEGKELFDSAALRALLKAATGTGSDGGPVSVTSQDGSRLFSVERPAGLGSSLPSVKSALRANRPNLFTSSHTTGRVSDDNLSEEDKKKLENLQHIRVKFLRLVHRLGYSPEESIAAQILYRLALVAGRQNNQLFSLDTAKRTALELEAEGTDDLNFSLNILVLGKPGVGKSATINSIFGEEKSTIHAFEPATTYVKEITGTVYGVKIRVIDTPGLKSSGSEQGSNRKVLSSINKFMKKFPPDVVLYVDRMDTQTRDLNDLPLLRSITSSLGSSIWRSAIVTLTHAASAPPDGPSGSPLSYEVFVAQRSHVVQQSIGQAVGDLRLMSPSLMSPVCLAENHPSCRKNKDGQKVLPNGQSWRPQLLLLCYSIKILSEATSISKPQDPFDHRKLFGFRVRSAPLPYLLSWLLQSRNHPKLSTDQGGDSVDSDVDFANSSDSDEEEEEDEYDQLPPFKPLQKSQLAKLSKEQRKAYFEEYDYRVKLLQKKQWREELRRMREIKKKGKVAPDEYGYSGDDVDPENEGPAAVPVPLPDMVLPPTFDGDYPAYRYRFLEPTSQFLARPVLDTHGWDHDCGYDGVNVEHGLAIYNRFPAAVTVQVTKDKKEFNIHLDSSMSAKHGENGSSMAGFDIQNVGKQLAYTVRGETKFKNLKKNKTATGISVTFLGENVATGFKLEDQISLGKQLVLVGSAGTVRSQGDSAYGANLEVRSRDADYPISLGQSSLGLSLVKWKKDLALGANLQSQFSIGRSSKIAVRAGLNNKMSGQISVRTSSSDQLQIALVGLLPIATAIYKNIWPGVGDNYSMY